MIHMLTYSPREYNDVIQVHIYKLFISINIQITQTFCIKRWKTVGAFLTPNGITRNSYKPR